MNVATQATYKNKKGGMRVNRRLWLKSGDGERGFTTLHYSLSFYLDLKFSKVEIFFKLTIFLKTRSMCTLVIFKDVLYPPLISQK